MPLGKIKNVGKENVSSNDIKFLVIAVVVNPKNEVLVVKRKVFEGFLELCEVDYDPGEIWFAPTGYQIKGETREEAAERIVLQETGYKVKARYQIPNTLVHHHSPKGNSFFKITVLCDLVGKEKKFQKPDYIKDIKWFTKEELWQNTLPDIKNKWPESLRKILT